VWRDQHVLHGPKRRGGGKRLVAHDIEAGGGDALLGKRADERILIHDTAACDVDKVRRRLHQAQRLGVDQVGGLGGKRAGERHDVGGWDERVKAIVAVHGVSAFPATAGRRAVSPPL
jgi:hypothetical protein